jgi:hypothetical protein
MLSTRRRNQVKVYNEGPSTLNLNRVRRNLHRQEGLPPGYQRLVFPTVNGTATAPLVLPNEGVSNISNISTDPVEDEAVRLLLSVLLPELNTEERGLPVSNNSNMNNLLNKFSKLKVSNAPKPRVTNKYATQLVEAKPVIAKPTFKLPEATNENMNNLLNKFTKLKVSNVSKPFNGSKKKGRNYAQELQKYNIAQKNNNNAMSFYSAVSNNNAMSFHSAISNNDQENLNTDNFDLSLEDLLDEHVPLVSDDPRNFLMILSKQILSAIRVGGQTVESMQSQIGTFLKYARGLLPAQEARELVGNTYETLIKAINLCLSYLNFLPTRESIFVLGSVIYELSMTTASSIKSHAAFAIQAAGRVLHRARAAAAPLDKAVSVVYAASVGALDSVGNTVATSVRNGSLYVTRVAQNVSKTTIEAGERLRQEALKKMIELANNVISVAGNVGGVVGEKIKVLVSAVASNSLSLLRIAFNELLSLGSKLGKAALGYLNEGVKMLSTKLMEITSSAMNAAGEGAMYMAEEGKKALQEVSNRALAGMVYVGQEGAVLAQQASVALGKAAIKAVEVGTEKLQEGAVVAAGVAKDMGVELAKVTASTASAAGKVAKEFLQEASTVAANAAEAVVEAGKERAAILLRGGVDLAGQALEQGGILAARGAQELSTRGLELARVLLENGEVALSNSVEVGGRLLARTAEATGSAAVTLGMTAAGGVYQATSYTAGFIYGAVGEGLTMLPSLGNIFSSSGQYVRQRNSALLELQEEASRFSNDSFELPYGQRRGEYFSRGYRGGYTRKIRRRKNKSKY